MNAEIVIGFLCMVIVVLLAIVVLLFQQNTRLGGKLAELVPETLVRDVMQSAIGATEQPIMEALAKLPGDWQEQLYQSIRDDLLKRLRAESVQSSTTAQP